MLGVVHSSEACSAELARHEWSEALALAGETIFFHILADTEVERARETAGRIASHSTSKDPNPDNHIGEAQVMALAEIRFPDAVILLDEKAARAVAIAEGLRVSGFPGVLLLAVEEGYLSADEARARLEQCRQQGTHYASGLVERIDRTAKEAEG